MYYYDRKNDRCFIVEGDESAGNPRLYGECQSTFITFERNYESPDKNEFGSFNDVIEHFGAKYTGHMKNDLDSLMENALKRGYVLLPVWKYEHTGLSYEASEKYPFSDNRFGAYSESDGYMGGWDGGLSGVIYEKRNGRSIEEVKNHLKGEVEEYSIWANGDVVRVDEIDENGDVIDGIGGIYPDYRYGDKDNVLRAINDYFVEEGNVVAEDIEEFDSVEMLKERLDQTVEIDEEER